METQVRYCVEFENGRHQWFFDLKPEAEKARIDLDHKTSVRLLELTECVGNDKRVVSCFVKELLQCILTLSL